MYALLNVCSVVLIVYVPISDSAVSGYLHQFYCMPNAVDGDVEFTERLSHLDIIESNTFYGTHFQYKLADVSYVILLDTITSQTNLAIIVDYQ